MEGLVRNKATIDISNNPGVGELTFADIQFAEDRGWEISPLSEDPHALTNVTATPVYFGGNNYGVYFNWTIPDNNFYATLIWESINGGQYQLVATILREDLLSNNSYERHLPIQYSGAVTDNYSYRLTAYSGNNRISPSTIKSNVYNAP